MVTQRTHPDVGPWLEVAHWRPRVCWLPTVPASSRGVYRVKASNGGAQTLAS